MINRILILLTLFLSPLVSIAQELSVKTFEVRTNDLSARTQSRQDNNGNDCALVKVQLAASGAKFEGNVVGDVKYDTSEYWVYMPQGSKRLTIKVEGYLPLNVSFEDQGVKGLEAKTTYVMTVTGIMVNGQMQEAPRTKTGWIILDSSPQGASVYINGNFVGNTPLNNYKQAYGTYSYRLEHPNYHETSGTIELNDSRIEKTVTMTPAFGSIRVTSNTAGATVLLDGKSTGKVTPCTLEEVPSGQHSITIQLDKYAPQQLNVNVEDGKTAQISAELDARFANVTINSVEGAEIFSNGKLLGTSKYVGDMMEGFYDVEVRLTHHKPAGQQLQVTAGKAQNITLNPTPIYGSLDVVSTPHDAEITIDGKSYGKTPTTIENLLEGEHTVSLALSGYSTITEKFMIKENENSTVSLNLQKEVVSSNRTVQNDGSGRLVLASFFSLKEKAEQGDAKAQNELATMYYKGDGVSQDYSEALKWYRKAAEQDYAIAQYYIGLMYGNGLGVPQNVSEAVKWYTKSAEQGNDRAQNELGRFYNYGRGVPRNYSEALKWYKKSAEQGNAHAINNIGAMYEDGTGVPQDYSEAVKWYRKAAEQGNVVAQKNLGWMYYKGQGVLQNDSEAVKWYRIAAEQGNVHAQFNLGWMYSKGKGVPQDYSEAAKWYRKAAEQGNASAQYNLGIMYDTGRGVRQDYSEAAKWYRKAAAQGHANAKKELQKMGY